MILSKLRPFFALSLGLALAGAALLGGCSRFLPAHRGAASSLTIVIDTRRDPVPQLAGCFVPETFPAYTKVPVVFLQKIPTDAKFLSATAETQLKNGDPLALLEAVIDHNQVYLKFAVSKMDAFTQQQVAVTAQYEYR